MFSRTLSLIFSHLHSLLLFIFFFQSHAISDKFRKFAILTKFLGTCKENENELNIFLENSESDVFTFSVYIHKFNK